MAQPLSFRWDPVFVARIDVARRTPLGTISRSAFVRDAVELAIRHAEVAKDLAEDPTGVHAQESMARVRAVIDFRETPDFDRDGGMVPLSAYRRSSEAKRDVRPIPKGKR